MPDLADGATAEMQGSGAKPYTLKNVGGVYSCSCPAWRNQSTPIERRTCKHLRKFRGDAAEEARLGAALPAKPVAARGDDAPAGPPLLLSESWTPATDPTGFWVSEKLDGVRAYWDGAAFASRLGNRYHAPDWFTAGLPDTPLDGELWIGRKQFQRTVGTVRRQDQPATWNEVRFVVFDAPACPGPFETRLAHLKATLLGAAEYATLLDHAVCSGIDHLRQELARIEALGGEGLMLRQPGSAYAVGRSATLLKVKSFLDAEAVVVGHEPGKGSTKGGSGRCSCGCRTARSFPSARACPTPSGPPRRPSGRPSRSATRSCPTAASRGSRVMSAFGRTGCEPGAIFSLTPPHDGYTGPVFLPFGHPPR